MAPRKVNDGDASAPGLTSAENKFIKTMFDNMKTRPDADWDKVAEQMSLKDAKCAKERFRQIAQRHGWNNKSESGSSKVTKKKPAAGRGRKKAAPVKKREDEEDDDDDEEEMAPEEVKRLVKKQAAGPKQTPTKEESDTEEGGVKSENDEKDWEDVRWTALKMGAALHSPFSSIVATSTRCLEPPQPKNTPPCASRSSPAVSTDTIACSSKRAYIRCFRSYSSVPSVDQLLRTAAPLPHSRLIDDILLLFTSPTQLLSMSDRSISFSTSDERLQPRPHPENKHKTIRHRSYSARNMSKQDPEQQIRFLVTCIGHTANGRPNFQSVADELGIVSKAAAHKRYERLLKQYSITSKPAFANNGAEEKSSPKSSPPKRKANGQTKARKPAAKKVKSEPDSPDRSDTPVKAEAREEDDEQSAISDTVKPHNSDVA
ncbi:hypothetical protein NLU13_6324 [Sarocladium strictum]|uniref:Myb-like DNA-binding domain-containing protein n=1 Tax=Sarocladium strictum TaxID=5046 RepID=A0AA39GGE6_SARSR|nr:hypothetical protein NLU13_6324 [Sarocladium strictum]